MNKQMTSPKRIQMFPGEETHYVPTLNADAVIEPSHGDIARRAYDIYVMKGNREGECEMNWKQAEQDLLILALAKRAAMEARNCCEGAAAGRS